ncbi:hypothetical protein AB0A74_13370 [Saccharothrix sp. NPDC042600]|uniref:hypothetical protein n=1 Tax=Saccharothrix TaxID=2071 RepID=UPI0033FE01C3|nr:hypothetical protein GCM10017745_38310 [Saccharothrix mutabilis subsp. capreolus]
MEDHEFDATFNSGDNWLTLAMFDLWVGFLTSKLPWGTLEATQQTFHGLPMSGVGRDDFYAVPAALCHQDLDMMGRVYETVAANRLALDDGMEKFQDGCNTMFRNWRGEAQGACATYGGAIMDFVNEQRDATADLAASVLGCAGAVKKAREDWLALADAFVGALNQKAAQDRASGWKVVITSLATITAAAVTVVSSGMTAFAGALAAVATDIAAEAAKESLDAEKYQDIAQNYLRASRQVLDQLDAANIDVERKLRGISSRDLTPPPQPLDIGAFDRNPGGQLTPEHRTDNVDRWLDKKTKQAQTEQPRSPIASRLTT